MEKNKLKELMHIAQEKQAEVQKCAITIFYAPNHSKLVIKLHAGDFLQYVREFCVWYLKSDDRNFDDFDDFLFMYNKYEYGNPTSKDYNEDFVNLSTLQYVLQNQ